MPVKLGVVMDPIASIHVAKDTTLALLLAAQRQGYALYYMEMNDLFIRNGQSYGRMCSIKVFDNEITWFQLEPPQETPLADLDVLLMRKDPPVNMHYIEATYILELAETAGLRVINKPQSLRDANEKLCTQWFPELCPPTLVTADIERLRNFIHEQQRVVLKILDAMGGAFIFLLNAGDINTQVILESLTKYGTEYIMAQRFIPEIAQGDKRIILIDGTPIPYGLARIPKANEIRGNLAAGGHGHGVTLTPRDYEICETIAPVLRAKGLSFVGIDVIGNYLTEINVTSPTCVREIDRAFGCDIGKSFMQFIDS